MTARRRYFQVRGKGNFPFRMLSVSEAFPASVKEAEKITLACPTVAPEQIIMLATNAATPPNGNLWREAGWPIDRME